MQVKRELARELHAHACTGAVSRLYAVHGGEKMSNGGARSLSAVSIRRASMYILRS